MWDTFIKTGLAAGVSGSQFGSEGKCTAQMYVTFVLRALGYSDKEGADFTYADALDFAVQIGLISARQRDEWSSREFIRDDLAGISYDALRQEIKEGRRDSFRKTVRRRCAGVTGLIGKCDMHN